MLEITSTRHNPLIDPHLAVWSWEIPLYLFVGGIVAGMMVLGGLAMLRLARGDDTRSFFSMQTPLLGFVLMNIGMLALLLDLTHRLYVWRIYLTFQVTCRRWPGVRGCCSSSTACCMVSALIRLPDAWPWLGRTVPVLKTWSDAHRRPAGVDRARWAGPTWCWASAWASTPASCSTPWSRGRCGTAPSSGPCSWSRACRPASR